LDYPPAFAAKVAVAVGMAAVVVLALAHKDWPRLGLRRAHLPGFAPRIPWWPARAAHGHRLEGPFDAADFKRPSYREIGPIILRPEPPLSPFDGLDCLFPWATMLCGKLPVGRTARRASRFTDAALRPIPGQRPCVRPWCHHGPEDNCSLAGPARALPKERRHRGVPPQPEAAAADGLRDRRSDGCPPLEQRATSRALWRSKGAPLATRSPPRMPGRP
jgi:hypothetical protein